MEAARNGLGRRDVPVRINIAALGARSERFFETGPLFGNGFLHHHGVGIRSSGYDHRGIGRTAHHTSVVGDILREVLAKNEVSQRVEI